MISSNFYCKIWIFIILQKVSLFLMYRIQKFNKSFPCIKFFCISGDCILLLYHWMHSFSIESVYYCYEWKEHLNLLTIGKDSLPGHYETLDTMSYVLFSILMKRIENWSLPACLSFILCWSCVISTRILFIVDVKIGKDTFMLSRRFSLSAFLKIARWRWKWMGSLKVRLILQTLVCILTCYA